MVREVMPSLESLESRAGDGFIEVTEAPKETENVLLRESRWLIPCSAYALGSVPTRL